MFQVHSFTFNPFSENSYLIVNEAKRAIVADPGMSSDYELEQFYQFLEKEGIVPVKICNTHAHIDHIFGVKKLKERFNIPFGLHEKEIPILESAQVTAQMFGFDFDATPEVDFFISEKEGCTLDDEQIDVLFTPGHSPGSISYYFPQEKMIISGDVLFQNGIGRTDLPGGDFDVLYTSIKTQLFTLPEETKVYSGHGPATTIGTEKKYGYLAGMRL